MKKYLLLSLMLLSGILFTACGNKTEENTPDSEDNNKIDENVVDSTDNKSDEIIIEPKKEIEEVDTCENTIQKYLDWADKEWQWEEIKVWDNITVDYIWRLEDWTVFDTSIESIAKACWKYNEGGDYTQWLSFEVWSAWLIEWFNEWVVWMKLWQTKTVQFGPEKWYGEYDENLIITAPISEVWDVSQFKEWDTVYLWMWYPAKIVKITDKEVSFDMNSELAGKSLIFDITVKSIN